MHDRSIDLTADGALRRINSLVTPCIEISEEHSEGKG